MRTLCLLFAIIPTILFSQDYYFPPLTGDDWVTSDLQCDAEAKQELLEFLDENDTKAFIILKEGKILMEEYFDAFTKDSIWYWASAGKTVTATLVGLAQADGSLDINDPTSDYLGEWTSCSQADQDNIQIRHQLTMTTGFDDGSDFECLSPECLVCDYEPGTRWSYHNAPYTLLLSVVEEATGLSPNAYYNQKIGQKIGAAGVFINAVQNDNRVFWSKPRTMARFGLLHLANGTWNGQEIFTNDGFFFDMKHTSQALNKSYGYLWWLNGKESYRLPSLNIEFNGNLIPNAPADLYAGLGKNDQKLYITPSQDLVVVRLGNAADGNNQALSNFDNALWEKINLLNCSIDTHVDESAHTEISIYPNPASDQLTIEAANIEYWTLTNLQGQALAVGSSNKVSLAELSSGVYFLAMHLGSGSRIVERIVRE